MEKWDVAIIGGGPSGLMAGVKAAERGRRTLLLEKNHAPGAKILIAGGGRCNLTHACDARGIIDALGPSGKFLHSALAAFGPRDVVDFFHLEGMPTYIEPGSGKVFPKSNRAADVLAVLLHRFEAAEGELATSEPLVELERELDFGNFFHLTTTKRTLLAEKVLLATGGKSYPACGTTGDGYRFAEKLGHTIIPPRPALTPLTTNIQSIRELQGISLPDVIAKIMEPAEICGGEKPRCLASRREAILFTHFGVSGPAAMDLSRVVTGYEAENRLVLEIDLLPEIDEKQLAILLAGECVKSGKKTSATLIDQWLPHRVALEAFAQNGLDPKQRVAEFSKADQHALVYGVKHFCISISGTLGFRFAEVTAGGVALSEVDSRTMQSKKTPNLYFSGELLDLDGPIGGYNFQIAFSTGFLAGNAM